MQLNINGKCKYLCALTFHLKVNCLLMLTRTTVNKSQFFLKKKRWHIYWWFNLINFHSDNLHTYICSYFFIFYHFYLSLFLSQFSWHSQLLFDMILSFTALLCPSSLLYGSLMWIMVTVNSTAEVRRDEVLEDAGGDSSIKVSCSQLWGAWRSHKDKCK